MNTDVIESGQSSAMRRPLVWLSQSVSRRGFIARSFRVTAAALGVAVAYRTIGMPQLPVPEAEATHTCGSACICNATTSLLTEGCAACSRPPTRMYPSRARR